MQDNNGKLTPNFDSDNEIGKIGEARLKYILSKSPKTKKFKDVSDDKRNQRKDIDVWQVTKDDNVIHYEVKTDRQGLYTRNVSYELTSHDYAGCLARSNAEYIFYVFVNPDNVTEIKEQYLINLLKWRKWLGENCRYINKRKDIGFLTYSTQKDSDGVPMDCMQFITNIDTMVKDGVAIPLDSEGNKIININSDEQV